jgi:hypothetical protein
MHTAQLLVIVSMRTLPLRKQRWTNAVQSTKLENALK